jgi:hypothetical protein
VQRAYYSSVYDQPVAAAWQLVRDFNNYPLYIEGVTESVIENGKRGDEVGAVRRFRYGGAWIGQRLTAHSDDDRAFTYAGLEPFEFPAGGATPRPAPIEYRGTLKLTPIIDGNRTFVEWFVDFAGNASDSPRWKELLLQLIPQWVESLGRTLAGQNPFGVANVPDPDGRDVTAFAATATLSGFDGDANASNWSGASDQPHRTIEGAWSSRWNGEGFDWQQGTGEIKARGDRVYILFDWGNGAGKGLIEAHRQGSDKLVGRYLNLVDPSITRPWVGLIVSNERIDGFHTGGRIDFRR